MSLGTNVPDSMRDFGFESALDVFVVSGEEGMNKGLERFVRWEAKRTGG